MKIKALVLSLILVTAFLAGCGSKAEPEKKAYPADAVTTASIVNDQAAFLKAASKEGTWIIAILKDLKVDKEIVLEGEFKNKDAIARKIALYTQDDKRNVTARFTLTAPKLTVKSENARIQSGTFIGDIYVEAKDFNLVDAKVQGNVYFANEDAKSTFKMDKTSSVSGVTELKK